MASSARTSSIVYDLLATDILQRLLSHRSVTRTGCSVRVRTVAAFAPRIPFRVSVCVAVPAHAPDRALNPDHRDRSRAGRHNQWVMVITDAAQSLSQCMVESETPFFLTFRADTGTVGAVPSGHDAAQIATDPMGKFAAVAASDGIHVYTVNALGALAQAAGSPFGSSAQSVMFDPSGAYTVALQSSKVTVYSVNGGSLKAAASATPGQYSARVVILKK